MSMRVEMTCRRLLLLLLAVPVAVAVAACAFHGASAYSSAAASAGAAAAATGKLSSAADVEEGTACVDGRQCAADLGDEWKGRSQTRREWSRKRDPTLEDRIRSKEEWFEMLAREMPHLQGKDEWGDVEIEAFDSKTPPAGALDDAGWEPVEEREWDVQCGMSDCTSGHSHADADADTANAASASVAATGKLSTVADVEAGAESGGARQRAAAREGEQQQVQDSAHGDDSHIGGDDSSMEQRRRSKEELLAELFGDEPEGNAEEEEEWGDVEVEHLDGDSSHATEESATLTSPQSDGGERGMERAEEDDESEWDDAYDDEPFCSGCSNVWRPRDLKRMGL